MKIKELNRIKGIDKAFIMNDNIELGHLNTSLACR